MRNRAHHGPDAGWNSAPARGPWRQAFVAVTAGAVSMGLLACALALAHATTGHNWYAAARITIADILIVAGFDGETPVEYRAKDGIVETFSRYRLTFLTEARWAREDILEAAWKGAALGGISGFGDALLCLALVRRSGDDRRDRRSASGPTPERLREARVPPASIQEQPTFVPPPPPASPAPAHARLDRSSVSSLPPPAKPEPAVARQVGDEGGGDNGTAPAEPRGRTYGRWV